jgi:hypothetical protein
MSKEKRCLKQKNSTYNNKNIFGPIRMLVGHVSLTRQQTSTWRRMDYG